MAAALVTWWPAPAIRRGRPAPAAMLTVTPAEGVRSGEAGRIQRKPGLGGQSLCQPVARKKKEERDWSWRLGC